MRDFLSEAIMRVLTAVTWASRKYWRIGIAVLVVALLAGLWWVSSRSEDTRRTTHVSERVVGDSVVLDSSQVWMTDLAPIFSGPEVQTTDSTGEQKTTYRIPTSRSEEDQTTETVRIESGKSATELLVRPPQETRLFPHFRSPQNFVTVLSGHGVSITRKHRSFIDIHFSPAIGAAITSNYAPSASIGATVLRVGPVFLGGSVLVSKEQISASVETSIDVATRLNLSVGVTNRKAVNVGLRYRF